MIARLRFGADHRWVPKHVSAYLDGDLSLSGRERIERHVHDCHRCRELLAGLRSMLESLRGIGREGEPEVATAVLSGFRERMGERGVDDHPG